MADASESRLNIDAPVEKRGRGRPHGNKNKTTVAAMGASSSALVKRLIRLKRIYFSEHFCYCFFFNLCVLNTTNTD
jgi:hypothetical protein